MGKSTFTNIRTGFSPEPSQTSPSALDLVRNILHVDREAAIAPGPWTVTVRTRDGREVTRRFASRTSAELYRLEIVGFPGIAETSLSLEP
jgi:hypothetical protein